MTDILKDSNFPSIESPKPLRSLLRTTSLVAFMTSISRVLGFLRDLVVAHFFGADAAVDAFLIAFKIPNFLRRLFAEGAFSQAFVPVLARYREEHEGQLTPHFINQIATALSGALFLITIFGVLCAPILILIFAPGFHEDSQRYALATSLLQITFPYLFFISLTAFFASILNSYERFGIASFTPVLLNLSMIFTSMFFKDYFTEPIFSLAWGVFLGGVLQLAFQYPFLKKIQLAPKILWGKFFASYQTDGVQRVLKLMLPALFGVSVAQINLLMDTVFASFLNIGSVSWLYFSDRLIEFPLGVFGVALSTVSLPRLSRQVALKDTVAFNHTLDWGMRTVLLISIPSALGLIFLAEPILSTLFQYGKFSSYDMFMTSKSLRAFAFGLPAFMLVKIFACAFYSHHEMKIPVRAGVIAMIVNFIFNVLLISHFAHMGLALSTSIAAYVNVSILFLMLKKKNLFHPALDIQKFLMQIFVANFLLICVLVFLNPSIFEWMNKSWLEKGLHLGFILGAAMATYFVALFSAGFDWHTLRRH